MKQMTGVLLCAAAVSLWFSGCEFEGITDAVTGRGYDWVNLSGLYRNPQGGAMVTSYTTSPGDAASTNTVTGEIIGYGISGYTVYSGTFNNKEVGKGTVAISAGGFVFNDNGDGTLIGSAETTGTVDYDTGAWSIDLKRMTIPSGTQIIASYQYEVGGTAGKVMPGSTKTTIYSMIALQSGNQVSLTDSDGYAYTGKLFSVSSTTGEGQSQTAGQIIAPFRVYGVSKAKVNVTIDGTFTATYLATESDAAGGGAVGQTMGRPILYLLSNRRIDGTWVETNADGKILKTGNVVGTTTDLGDEDQGSLTI